MLSPILQMSIFCKAHQLATGALLYVSVAQKTEQDEGRGHRDRYIPSLQLIKQPAVKSAESH